MQRETEAKEAGERAEAEAEAQRLELLRMQYEAAIPDEIHERVQVGGSVLRGVDANCDAPGFYSDTTHACSIHALLV